MTEYHIQKRGLQVWQYVTWYENLADAKANYDTLVAGKGWSYRIVKLEVIEEAKLEGEYKDVAPAAPEPARKPVQAINDPWATRAAQNLNEPAGEAGIKSILDLDDTHGGIGKVWMLRRDIKQRARVNPNEVDYYLSQGWVKGGPKTPLE